jgi:hypothetical protein
MDLTVGTKVYFVERTHPSWRYPHAVGHCRERRKALHAAAAAGPRPFRELSLAGFGRTSYCARECSVSCGGRSALPGPVAVPAKPTAEEIALTTSVASVRSRLKPDYSAIDVRQTMNLERFLRGWIRMK